MANRLVKWGLFTILFAFIPIAISLLLTYLTGSSKNLCDYNTEVLFFTIMISSTSLSNIIGLNSKVKDFILTIFIGFFILLVLCSSIIYGSLLYGEMTKFATSLFKERIFYISGILALISGVLGTVIQVMLSRTEAIT